MYLTLWNEKDGTLKVDRKNSPRDAAKVVENLLLQGAFGAVRDVRLVESKEINIADFLRIYGS